MAQTDDTGPQLVGIETEDGDQVIYDRDSPSSAWIRTGLTMDVEE